MPPVWGRVASQWMDSLSSAGNVRSLLGRNVRLILYVNWYVSIYLVFLYQPLLPLCAPPLSSPFPTQEMVLPESGRREVGTVHVKITKTHLGSWLQLSRRKLARERGEVSDRNKPKDTMYVYVVGRVQSRACQRSPAQLASKQVA